MMTRARAAPASFGSRRTTPDFVDRLIAHDEAAYEELVRTHGPRMRTVALRYLPHAADADDVVQDALVNVVRSIAAFRRACRLETWLHRIVVNCALARLRRRHRKPETALEAATREAGAQSPWRGSIGPSAPDAVVRAETRRLVRAEVDRLPASQRSTVWLRDIEGLDLKAIAELLDVALSTVKVRLHRARHALHDALEPRL